MNADDKRIMSMDRRAFLAALASTTVAGHVWAAPKVDAKLLVVFLRGAYRAANVVIPVSSAFYYASRSNLAIARPNPAVATSALSLASNWGLHPALKDTIFPLFQKGQAAFIPFAGTDDLTRSHFETQDTIELGQTVGASRNYRSGFMARLAAVLTGARPIAFTDQMPLSFQGPASAPIPNIAINSVGKAGIDERQAALIAAMYSGKPLGASVREGFKVRDEVLKTVNEPWRRLGQGLRAFGATDWTPHARTVQPRLRRCRRLGHACQSGCGERLSRRPVGRTRARAERLCGRDRPAVEGHGGHCRLRIRAHLPRERQSRHRPWSWQRLLGARWRPERWPVAGEQTAVDQAHLFQDRDYPVLTDYRALLGGLFQRMYGLDQTALQRVFPSGKPRDLALL
jgi:hypothetical protein